MRDIQKYRYVAAGILTLVIFMLGVFLSNFVDAERSSQLQNSLSEDIASMESRQLQLSYLESGEIQRCDALEAGLKNIVSSYNKRLGRVQNYQEDSFFKADRFRVLKQRYIISGIRYWIFTQELREKCSFDKPTALFFTSDIDDPCPECKRLGEQLTLLKRETGGDLLVFSVPLEMDDGMIELLATQYNVTRPPAVVINGQKKFEGYHHRSDIRPFLAVNQSE